MDAPERGAGAALASDPDTATGDECRHDGARVRVCGRSPVWWARHTTGRAKRSVGVGAGTVATATSPSLAEALRCGRS
ncbi:MAG: hypothetical protein ACXWQZ_11000 [Ktedonobacterales bacterium]